MADRKSRRAALIAAASLIGPSMPPGFVASRPHEAATALTRMADLLVPWLEGASSSTQHITAPEAAATAVIGEHPGTGEGNGSTRSGTEAE